MRMPGFNAEKSLDGRFNRFISSIRIVQDQGMAILLQAKMDPSVYPYDPSSLPAGCRPHWNHIKYPKYYCEVSTEAGVQCYFAGWYERDVFVPC